MKNINHRIKKLFNAMQNNAIAILPTAPIYQHPSIEYSYQPDNNFFYLTGIVEPDCLAVFIKKQSSQQIILFIPAADEKKALWVGQHITPDGVKKLLSVDQIFFTSDIEKQLPNLIKSYKHLYYTFDRNDTFDQRIKTWINKTTHKPIDLANIIHEMRLIKSPEEINLIQQSVDLNILAFQQAISAIQPGKFEYEIAAELEHIYRKHHTVPAFNTIIAGGKNACTLHYNKLSNKLNNDELLLIDAGCSYHHYASDLSRTLPINGKFTAKQKALYDLVLNAQLAGIEQMHPGNPFNAPQETTEQALSEGLKKLNIPFNDIKEVYPHFFGHSLGLDAHDPGKRKIDNQWREFKPGMVLTAEPGLYLRNNAIGIRIEDIVLITETGNRVLSAALPK